MNDQPLSARPRGPGAESGNPPQRRRQPPPAAPASRESRFIGYLVLGFGAVACLAVLLLAFTGNSDPETKDANPAVAEQLAQDIAPLPETAAQQGAQPRIVQRQAEPPKELYFKRQPGIRAADVAGNWQAGIGRYTAVLQLRNGSYQIVYAEPGVAKRQYSSGTYTMKEDMIELTPRLDWPAPSSRSNASYEILTRAPFPVIAALQGGKMLWQNPPQSEKRVLVPYTSPAMAGEDARYIVWQPLK